MNGKFPQREDEMYPIIRAYFMAKLKCDHVFVDGDEAFVRLERNLHTGEVDLAALRDPDGKASQIHLVEAKCLTKRQSFEECFSQVDAVRDSGDRLWVALPEAQWKALPDAQRQKHEKRLNDFHFGLLLVTPEECYPEITAPLNPDRSDSGRTEVLQQLGFAIDPFLPTVSGLGRVEAQTAAGAMALICVVADMLYEIGGAGKGNRVTFHNYWGTPYDDEFISHGWFLPNLELSESLSCELDPFGRLLGDGVPTAWVGVEAPINTIFARLDGGSGFGTHVYLEKEWQWKMIPVADGSEAVRYWVGHDLDASNLYVRIEISGRMKGALKSDIERVIKEGEDFLSVGAGKPRRAGKKANRASP
jgi:hypothetical protein